MPPMLMFANGDLRITLGVCLLHPLRINQPSLTQLWHVDVSSVTPFWLWTSCPKHLGARAALALALAPCQHSHKASPERAKMNLKLKRTASRPLLGRQVQKAFQCQVPDHPPKSSCQVQSRAAVQNTMLHNPKGDKTICSCYSLQSSDVTSNWRGHWPVSLIAGFEPEIWHLHNSSSSSMRTLWFLTCVQHWNVDGIPAKKLQTLQRPAISAIQACKLAVEGRDRCEHKITKGALDSNEGPKPIRINRRGVASPTQSQKAGKRTELARCSAPVTDFGLTKGASLHKHYSWFALEFLAACSRVACGRQPASPWGCHPAKPQGTALTSIPAQIYSILLVAS